MSQSNEDNRLSMLVDGELDNDQMNQVLLDVLDDDARREGLKQLLLLRKTFAPWRSAEPSVELVVSTHRRSASNAHHQARQWISLAVSAMIGGLLVMGGFWMADQKGPLTQDQYLPRREFPTTVPPEEQREIAAVFALHQSVAGPLDWYADNASNIRLAAARSPVPAGRPVAVVLRLVPAGGDGRQTKDYLVVCREKTATTIDLPADAARGDMPPLQLTLWAVPDEKGIDVQYALTAEDALPAVLAGQRKVGLATTRLGQLALDRQLFDVAANAWVLNEEHVK